MFAGIMEKAGKLSPYTFLCCNFLPKRVRFFIC